MCLKRVKGLAFFVTSLALPSSSPGAARQPNLYEPLVRIPIDLRGFVSGPDRDRTDYLRHAMAALYQVSYGPRIVMLTERFSGPRGAGINPECPTSRHSLLCVAGRAAVAACGWVPVRVPASRPVSRVPHWGPPGLSRG
jgi:hypothetical protein